MVLFADNAQGEPYWFSTALSCLLFTVLMVAPAKINLRVNFILHLRPPKPPGCFSPQCRRVVPAQGQGARCPKALLLHRSKWQRKEGSTSSAACSMCCFLKQRKWTRNGDCPWGQKSMIKDKELLVRVMHRSLCLPHKWHRLVAIFSYRVWLCFLVQDGRQAFCLGH